jgi:membrane protein implicated in regulation of membrane protease activity
MLFFFTLAAALIVGAIVVLATKEWWALPIAFAVHLIGSAIAFVPTFRAAESGDKPDPVTEARLEEQEAEGTREPAGEGDRKMAI